MSAVFRLDTRQLIYNLHLLVIDIIVEVFIPKLRVLRRSTSNQHVRICAFRGLGNGETSNTYV